MTQKELFAVQKEDLLCWLKKFTDQLSQKDDPLEILDVLKNEKVALEFRHTGWERFCEYLKEKSYFEGTNS